MSLSLSYAHPEYKFDGADIEMARECGLLTPRNYPEFESDFDAFVRKQEESLQDELNEEIMFQNEMNLASYPYFQENEILRPGYIYEGYEIRVTTVSERASYGKLVTDTPTGNLSNVYIPMNLTKKFKLSVGQSLKVNLLLTTNNTNPWKAIYIWKKIEPQASSFINHELDEGSNASMVQVNFLIPHIDIGKAVGKGGWRVNAAIKKYAPQYQNYDNESLSKEIALNFDNVNGIREYTFVEAYFKNYKGESSLYESVKKAIMFLYA